MAKRTADQAVILTIEQFCAWMQMSERQYFRIKKAGQGPREMRLGRHIRISMDAAKAWAKERAK